MIARLIQQKVLLGSHVSFTLKPGGKISGILTEISMEYVTVENNDGTATILMDMIGAWDVLNGGEEKKEKTRPTPPEVNLPLDEDLEPPAEKPSHNPPANLETLKAVTQIIATYEARIPVAKIEPKIPDFTLPSDAIEKWGTARINIWNKVKNQYENANRINELHIKFGRIQPMTSLLKSLTLEVPSSDFLKRHLGHLYTHMNSVEEAISCFYNAATISQKGEDWRNLAALAIAANKDDVALHSLTNYFKVSPLDSEPESWHLYVGLIIKQKNYSSLNSLCESLERELNKEELKNLTDALIYIVRRTEGEESAAEVLERVSVGSTLHVIMAELSSLLSENPPLSLPEIEKEIKTPNHDDSLLSAKANGSGFSRGIVDTYIVDKGYGFLRDSKGVSHFFHRSAVADDDFSRSLSRGDYNRSTEVIFEGAIGPKGPVAVQIYLDRPVNDLLKIAQTYVEKGAYTSAVAQLKRAAEIDSSYPGVQELYDKVREFARVAQSAPFPTGSNPFARAKRAQMVERDWDKAEQFLRQAITAKDNTESAIKDLAMLLAQRGKALEAVEVLKKYEHLILDRKSYTNLLSYVYSKANMADEAILTLQHLLSISTTNKEKESLHGRIASLYLSKENFSMAQQSYEKVLEIRPENTAAKRSVALCLSKQGDYEGAEDILNEILDNFPDAKAAELLDVITQARITGTSAKFDDIIIDTTLSNFTGELSTFSQFFLSRCEFTNIDPRRVKEGKYIGAERDARFDIDKLEELARQHGPNMHRPRSNIYLQAARLSMDIEGDRMLFYSYLGQSFAARGDDAILENKPIETAREWYGESLSLFDRDKGGRVGKNAENALIKYLFSTLGQAQVPISEKRRRPRTIDETIEEVISRHPQRDKVYEAIAYLVLYSRYASTRLLNSLHARSTLQATAVDYLRKKGVVVPDGVTALDVFVHCWNELRRKLFDEILAISNNLRSLVNVSFSTPWLESAIETVKSLLQRAVFDLDRRRLQKLQAILENLLELCGQVDFGIQETLSLHIDNQCQDLLTEINMSPTRLSIERVYAVIESIQFKVRDRLQQLYDTAKPQLTLRLAVDWYVPDNNQQVTIKVVIANKVGRSPAESPELVIEQHSSLFNSVTPEVKMDGSLRGGADRIMDVPLRISNAALEGQTFSLPVYCQYRTRTGEMERTSVEPLSVRLYTEDEFKPIDNPYYYAEGGIVGDSDMFYGRGELINRVARSISESRLQSKCVMIFGQKRAGKSSILHHLKHKLEDDTTLIILDIGSIGSLIDEHSQAPLLHQILWGIISKLQDAIADREERGGAPLDMETLKDLEFLGHPSPLLAFKSFFDKFKQRIARNESWTNCRVVLLIDEFAFIYTQIIAKKIADTFMTNWKALLQENYFNTVLVGPDVMEKFHLLYSNDFGTVQDERVTYLKTEDAIKLIDEPIRIGGRQGETRYRERAIERILELTAGSPFYIQMICYRLVDHMNRIRAPFVTQSEVEQVKKEMISGVNPLSLAKFENLINAGDTSSDAIPDEDVLNVLKAIALNSRTGPCSRNSITCQTTVPIDTILEDLKKRLVISVERESYYQIRVGLFNEWLIHYSGGRN